MSTDLHYYLELSLEAMQRLGCEAEMLLNQAETCLQDMEEEAAQARALEEREEAARAKELEGLASKEYEDASIESDAATSFQDNPAYAAGPSSIDQAPEISHQNSELSNSQADDKSGVTSIGELPICLEESGQHDGKGAKPVKKWLLFRCKLSKVR